jgi:anti-sigma B factor antagonist
MTRRSSYRVEPERADPNGQLTEKVQGVTELELESRSSGHATIVVVRGEIDMATAPDVRDVLNELIDAGASRIVLDCRGLDFLDSSGIGVLIAVRKRLGDDGALTLEAPQAHVRKVLELTGVLDHVEIAP